MKNIWILIIVIVVVAISIMLLFSFQVRETEVALVTTFGKASRTETEPGLKFFKWPRPINVVHKFDSRCQLFEIQQEETNTKGGEPIRVTSYVVWKIGDPQRFLNAVKDKTGAEDKIRILLRNTQNSVIGRHYFSEFVNSDPDKIKFDEIEEEMKQVIASHALDEYGIDIKLVGIKQLGVDKEVTKDVFERMRADRLRKTNKILADGTAKADAIKAEADAMKAILETIAEAEAKAIRGEGDAEAAKHLEMLEEDPELAMFLREVDALKKILEEKSTIILGADTGPVKLLRGLPDIKPKQEE
jgi:membrane protease subunit HflC